MAGQRELRRYRQTDRALEMAVRNGKKLVPALLFAGVMTLAGCGGHYYIGASIGPPPRPVVYGPVGVAPGPGYVWTDGYYDCAAAAGCG